MEDQRVRPSDADRDAAEARLKTAVGEGRLTLEEFADRMGFALSADSREELARVTADLPAVRDTSAPAGPSGATRRAPVRRWLVAVMGGFSTSRRWRPAPRTNAVAVMGGGEVDLRSAEIEGDEVTITAVAVMGGIEVIVPRGVDVEMGGFAFMGGREMNVDERSLVPGAPLVRVNGYALMGGVEVRSETEKEARQRAEAEGREYVDPRSSGTVPAQLPRTLHGRPEHKSWWGRLVLAAAAVAVVAAGGPGAILPDNTAIFGGREIDLTRQFEADPGATIELEVGALFGGVEVTVPPGTVVENEALAIFGGVSDDVGEPPAGEEEPGTLVLDGGAMFGGITVTDGTQEQRERELEAQIEELERAQDQAEEAGGDAAADEIEAQIERLEERLDDLD